MNTNNDLISVIIPAYNHERYVQKAILSVINQTYENLELIIVDDGSSDGTWDKICELSSACKKRFKKLIARKQENQGTLKTLHDTLYEASGKYIYYIASDDIAHPQAIEKLHANIGDAALIFPDLAYIDEKGERFYYDDKFLKTYDAEIAKYRTLHDVALNRLWPDVDDEGFDFYFHLLEYNCINIGFLMLKEAAIDVGGWNKDVVLEDYYIYLQLAKKYTIKRIKETLFYYRRHETNSSSDTEKMKKAIKMVFMNEKEYCYRHSKYKARWNSLYFKRYFREGSFLKKLRFMIFRSV